jgi:hypothetical protein
MDMCDDRGSNVEIAATSRCNPETLDMDWAWGCEWYGEPHLIRSLYKMKAVYKQPTWRRLWEFADYTLFLGYSGIILAEAFERLGFRSNILIVWGLHDGDLFFLGRTDKTGFRRLATATNGPPEGPFLRIWDGE